jgi:hypothetical protein
MINSILVEDLADAPAQLWPKLIERHQILAPLAAQTALTVADADEGARRLGLTRRRFYSQLAAFKIRSRHGVAYSYKTGRNRVLSVEQHVAIQDAHDAVGDRARLTTIYAEVRRICAIRQIPAPALTSVNTRLGRCPSPIDLRTCFKLVVPIAPDAAGLRIEVTDGQAAEPARIAAVFCTTTSRVLWHKLYLGMPPKDELAADVRAQLIALCPALETDLKSPSTPFENWRVKSLRSSAIFRRAFGPILGRLRIAFPERITGSDGYPSVPIAVAREVIGEIIERRNKALRDALFVQPTLPANSGIPVLDCLEYGSEKTLDLVA